MGRLFLILYQTLIILLFPLIYGWLFYRLHQGKETHISFKEKLCKSLKPRPEGKLVWVHLASVGEFISAVPLIKELQKKNPNASFLITSITVNSAKVFEEYNLTNTIHQFLPIDSSYHLNKFFKHFKPDCGIFVDSEIWPNLINTASKFCNLVLVNGRMSPKSYSKWVTFKSVAEYFLRQFKIIMPYSKMEVKKFQHLSPESNVKYLVNLKYLSPKLPYNPTELEDFKAYTQNRLVWVAASTHKGEEELIMTTHKILKKTLPNVLTIIIPRHPNRGNEIKDLITTNNLSCYLRSEGEVPDDSLEVYLANTLNELGLFYSLASISFVGGSLVSVGGHNILEPARLSSAIIVGNYTFNFHEIISEFKEEKALLEVSSARELATQLEYLFRNPADVEKLVSNATNIVNSQDGNLSTMIDELNKHLSIY